jgi:hypothetical protein
MMNNFITKCGTNQLRERIVESVLRSKGIKIIVGLSGNIIIYEFIKYCG